MISVLFNVEEHSHSHINHFKDDLGSRVHLDLLHQRRKSCDEVESSKLQSRKKKWQEWKLICEKFLSPFDLQWNWRIKRTSIRVSHDAWVVCFAKGLCRFLDVSASKLFAQNVRHLLWALKENFMWLQVISRISLEVYDFWETSQLALMSSSGRAEVMDDFWELSF